MLLCSPPPTPTPQKKSKVKRGPATSLKLMCGLCSDKTGSPAGNRSRTKKSIPLVLQSQPNPRSMKTINRGRHIRPALNTRLVVQADKRKFVVVFLVSPTPPPPQLLPEQLFPGDSKPAGQLIYVPLFIIH